MNLDTLKTHAKAIENAQRASRLAASSSVWYPSATPATSLGYRCERRVVYQRTRSAMARPVGEELASIFKEGKHHEKQVRAELSELGYEVVESEVNFKDRALDITGTIDGKIGLPDEDGRHGETRVPAEIKSWAGSPPRDGAAMRASDGLIGRYFAQMQTYLFLTSEPFGLFLFKSKLTGLWSVIPTALDYEYTETLLRRAERIRDCVQAIEDGGDVLPDRLPDRSECGGCPFADTICHPADADIDPLLLAGDEGLEAEIIEREGLDTARRRYKKLDDGIKARFKLTKGDRFVCGDFTITKRPHGKGVRVDIKRLMDAEENG